jgi:hypothetical protein
MLNTNSFLCYWIWTEIQHAASITSLKPLVKMAESDRFSVEGREGGGGRQVSTVFIHWNTFHYSCWWKSFLFCIHIGPMASRREDANNLTFSVSVSTEAAGRKALYRKTRYEILVRRLASAMYRAWRCRSHQHNEIKLILTVTFKIDTFINDWNSFIGYLTATCFGLVDNLHVAWE